MFHSISSPIGFAPKRATVSKINLLLFLLKFSLLTSSIDFMANNRAYSHITGTDTPTPCCLGTVATLVAKAPMPYLALIDQWLRVEENTFILILMVIFLLKLR